MARTTIRGGRTVGLALAVLVMGCGGVSAGSLTSDVRPDLQEDARPKQAGGVRAPPALAKLDGSSSLGSGAPPRIVRYRETHIADEPDDLDLAARSSGEVALAWAGVDDGVRGARVVRLDPALRVMPGGAGCIGPSSADHVALTALAAGWAFAVSWHEGPSTFVDLYFVDDQGQYSQRAHFAGAYHAFFADRETGPLLVLTDREQGGRVRAVLLDAQAEPVWERRIAGSTIEPEYASAVFTGESFLVGARANGVTLVPVGLDGAVGPSVSPVGPSTEYPQLVWTGSSAIVIYADFGGQPQLDALRVDSRGSPLDPAVPIGEPRQYYNYSPGVAVGRDRALVLLGGYTGGTGQSLPLDLGLFTGTSLHHAPRRLADDGAAVRNYDIARTGSSVVAAWVGKAVPFRGRGSIFVATIE